MAGKQINEYPESTNPSGNWFVLVDDGTGCYKKVKLSNLPGGGSSTTSTTTTAAGGSTTSSTTSTSTTVPIVPTTSTTTTAAFDPDALAFFEAAGITNPTQRSAVNTLVVSMKSDALWTKMKAVYPFVGGSASSHKYNLINPADSNAAFRLVFNGTWVHGANGATSNGIDAYADTFFNPLSQSVLYNFAFGVYTNINPNPALGVGGSAIPMGVDAGSGSNQILGFQNTGGNSILYSYQTGTNNTVYYTNIGGPEIYTKLVVTCRPTNSALKLYYDGVLRNTESTLTSSANPNHNIYIGAMNNAGTPQSHIGTRYVFAFMSDSLSDVDVTNLTNAVNAFQTTLGRAAV